MRKLLRSIEAIRTKVESLRRHNLKETPTRTIVIDPLLEALGWDVRDPDEVQLEYPTVDGKSVDYALKINKKVVLLVEAKALDDPLSDVKGITQVVGYAANAGIVWCVLTNGLKWQVYRSVEKCPAPDKLMFEISIDPHESTDVPVEQLADQFFRLSRDEMAKGTLDALGEQTFTDGKVRKVLDTVMRDPPRQLLNIVRKGTEDDRLTPKRIKESLRRIWRESGVGLSIQETVERSQRPQPVSDDGRRHAARKAWNTRIRKTEIGTCDESHHIAGKGQEVLALYQAVDRLCLSFEPGRVEKRYMKKYINYVFDGRIFCSVHLRQSGLRVWSRLKYERLDNPPSFARDVSNVGHYGTGDLELGLTTLSQLDEAALLIRKSFESPSL